MEAIWGFPFHFLVAVLTPYPKVPKLSLADYWWSFYVSLVFVLWDTLNQCCKHIDVANHRRDPQKHHEMYLGYLVLKDLLLYRLLTFRLQLFKLLIYWTDGEQLNPKKPQKQAWNQWTVIFCHYGCTYPFTIASSITSWWDIASVAKATLSLRIF